MQKTPVFRVRRPAAEVRVQTGYGLASGVKLHSPSYATWELAGNCQRPVNVEQVGEGHYQSAHKGEVEWQPNRVLSMMVRCRRCAACLRCRSLQWGTRAAAEFHQSTRTWFGTLTFAPEVRYRFKLATVQRLSEAGVSLDALVPADRFYELHRELGPEVTRYLKRLRDGAPSEGRPALTFRFLLTGEPHKDWSPHYHLLVHELTDLQPVRKRDLQSQWTHGHTTFKLCKDERPAYYAAKYLSKFSGARVRASLNYGEYVNTHIRSDTTMKENNLSCSLIET